jgi:hypothetical protein
MEGHLYEYENALFLLTRILSGTLALLMYEEKLSAAQLIRKRSCESKVTLLGGLRCERIICSADAFPVLPVLVLHKPLEHCLSCLLGKGNAFI